MRRVDLDRPTNSWDVGDKSTWTDSMKYSMTGANGVLPYSFVNATHSVLKYSGYVVGGFAYGAAYRLTSLVFNKLP